MGVNLIQNQSKLENLGFGEMKEDRRIKTKYIMRMGFGGTMKVSSVVSHNTFFFS